MPTRRKIDPNAVNRTNLIDAYIRFSPPQMPMRRYIGTSTISKKAKNSRRSSERNTPSSPASRTSIATMYCLVRSVIDFDPAIASVMRIPVRTIIQSEMPSTPSRHPIPSESEST